MPRLACILNKRLENLDQFSVAFSDAGFKTVTAECPLQDIHCPKARTSLFVLSNIDNALISDIQQRTQKVVHTSSFVMILACTGPLKPMSALSELCAKFYPHQVLPFQDIHDLRRIASSIQRKTDREACQEIGEYVQKIYEDETRPSSERMAEQYQKMLPSHLQLSSSDAIILQDRYRSIVGAFDATLNELLDLSIDPVIAHELTKFIKSSKHI